MFLRCALRTKMLKGIEWQQECFYFYVNLLRLAVKMDQRSTETKDFYTEMGL